MCRLFAARSAVPSYVRADLDALGPLAKKHKDGWGAAFYNDPNRSEAAESAHGLQRAFQDPDYRRLGVKIHARAALVHLRLATTGPVELENSHPFQHGRWSFAHNGRILHFDEHREAIEAQIAPDLRTSMKGQTDSERLFFLFLTRLRGLAPGGKPRASHVAQALAQTTSLVSELTDESHRKSSLNMIVTDGELMGATRRGNPLFVAAQTVEGSLPRLPWKAERLTSLRIASEPLSNEPTWHEVPPESVLVVDKQLRFQSGSLRAHGDRTPVCSTAEGCSGSASWQPRPAP